MEITWAYLFLDTASSDADEAWSFWQAVTASGRSAARGDHGEFATMLPAEGDPWVKLQRVGAPGGVHLDLHVTDRSAAVAQAVALGAEVRREQGEVTVLVSPGGFAFCLIEDPAAAAYAQVRPEQGTILDQLTLDIPADDFDSECDFWAALTGWEARSGALPQFRSLARPERIPLRILLQCLEEPTGVVGGHPDLACSDVAAAVMEHQALGSRAVDGGRFWTVMEHPVAGVYCLTVRSPRTGTLT